MEEAAVATAVAVEAPEEAVAAADNANPEGELNPQETTMDMHNTSAVPDDDGPEHAMKESIQAMAALIGQLQRREQALEDQVRQQMQLLQNAANNADQRVHRVVENALPRLKQLTQQALSVALDPAAERFDRTLTATNQQLQQATQRYAQTQQSLETTVMRRMWMGTIAMGVAAIMGLCAVAYALHGANATIAEAKQRRAEITYLDRVARANLVACGDDRLCADFEKKGPRYGDRGQYRVVTLRESQPR
ncbi:hypothetical protein LL965_15990 [Xanthomonas cassavae CFBP 4642]|uniref:Relaxation protein n=1 Tax=Xanthomonas cassavae CFBP 4642 TaxID=1219375 RepID=A0ABS8HH57_9XANT|nr:hypothetical protein [Xanthomonas cassavae]MCC4621509.1 hypothetical protein [Xanthomonas cassavae CFBP 4642]